MVTTAIRILCIDLEICVRDIVAYAQVSYENKVWFLGHIKKFLVSRPLKIEKVMRACLFYFYSLSFPQRKN